MVHSKLSSKKRALLCNSESCAESCCTAVWYKRTCWSSVRPHAESSTCCNNAMDGLAIVLTYYRTRLVQCAYSGLLNTGKCDEWKLVLGGSMLSMVCRCLRDTSLSQGPSHIESVIVSYACYLHEYRVGAIPKSLLSKQQGATLEHIESHQVQRWSHCWDDTLAKVLNVAMKNYLQKPIPAHDKKLIHRTCCRPGTCARAIASEEARKRFHHDALPSRPQGAPSTAPDYIIRWLCQMASLNAQVLRLKDPLVQKCKSPSCLNPTVCCPCQSVDKTECLVKLVLDARSTPDEEHFLTSLCCGNRVKSMLTPCSCFCSSACLRDVKKSIPSAWKVQPRRLALWNWSNRKHHMFGIDDARALDELIETTLTRNSTLKRSAINVPRAHFSQQVHTGLLEELRALLLNLSNLEVGTLHYARSTLDSSRRTAELIPSKRASVLKCNLLHALQVARKTLAVDAPIEVIMSTRMYDCSYLSRLERPTATRRSDRMLYV